MTTYKVLSIKQPHALLVMFGLKVFETRGRTWAISYRGDLLIHASASPITREQWGVMMGWYDKGWITEGILKLLGHDAPHRGEFAKESPFYGCILGSVNLTHIYAGVKLLPHLSEQERAFGWFDRGDRLALELSNPRLFTTSIPAAGSLGLWDYTTDALPEFITAEHIEAERVARATKAGEEPPIR